MIITRSARARAQLCRACWGGIVFSRRDQSEFAHKAVRRAPTADLVSAGAGAMPAKSPFAFVAETRQWSDGPIAVGRDRQRSCDLRGAYAGADFAYIGSAFIATLRPMRWGLRQMIRPRRRKHRVQSYRRTAII